MSKNVNNDVSKDSPIAALKNKKHPISQDHKVVWVVSRATGDLCYIVPALLACCKNSHVNLQSWHMPFLLFGNVF